MGKIKEEKKPETCPMCFLGKPHISFEKSPAKPPTEKTSKYCWEKKITLACAPLVNQKG